MERFPSTLVCVGTISIMTLILEASVGKELSCQRENGNRFDPFAVAMIKSGMTVGHVLRKISSVCSFFCGEME